jgi:hypothetical protein
MTQVERIECAEIAWHGGSGSFQDARARVRGSGRAQTSKKARLALEIKV